MLMEKTLKNLGSKMKHFVNSQTPSFLILFSL